MVNNFAIKESKSRCISDTRLNSTLCAYSQALNLQCATEWLLEMSLNQSHWSAYIFAEQQQV